MMVTVIGRGHSGTRAMSHTLSASGFYMGSRLNESGDLVPADELYEACRIMARQVKHLGGNRWDFSRLHTMKMEAEFVRLVESYLSSVLASNVEKKGWKLPETTLAFPWIVRMFPENHYIHWIRDPRDAVLGGHITDDLRDFNIDYPETDDVIQQRLISWKYQVELVKATPKPKHWLDIRFEDFVQQQDSVLDVLEPFLGFTPAKIPVIPEAVGRWQRTDTPPDFTLVEEDLRVLKYLA